MPEREERPHREQVAAVLAALDVAEVARRRPGAGDVAQESDRIDVQVDLRVRGGQPGPLREREDEREQRQRRDEESVARSQGGEDTVPPSMLRPIAAAALLALPTVLAFARGGYFDAARLRAGIAACLLAAVAATVAPRALPRGTAGRVALAGMAALTAWSALSLMWAPLAGPGVDDVERNVLYLAALVAAAALLTVGWTEAVLLAGIAATAFYGLSERLLPGLVELERSAAAGDRLAQPLTYWNAQGALAALGLVLAAGLIAGRARDATSPAVSPPADATPGRVRDATSPAGSPPADAPGRARDATSPAVSPPADALGRARDATSPAVSPPADAALGRVGAVAGALVPLLGLDLYLTLSRGALGALVAGLLVLVALVPTRAALFAVLLVAVGAAVPAVLAETALDGVMRADADAGAGAAMLVVLVLAGAACFAAAARIPRGGGEIAFLRPLAVTALVVALAVTVVSVRAGTPSTGSGRLVSVESNRYDYWRVAVATFAEHPLRGIGTGSFRVEWLLRRDREESVRDAHSLYLETAAELGLVGLRCARRAVRRGGRAPRGARGCRPRPPRSRRGPSTRASTGTGRCRRSRSSPCCWRGG